MSDPNSCCLSGESAPYALAPAYDMLPMAFAPTGGGSLPQTLPAANLRAEIPPALWRRAAEIAAACLQAMSAASGFSPAFAPCLNALAEHLANAQAKIARLG